MRNFVTYTVHLQRLNQKSERGEMGELKNAYRILFKKLMGIDHLEDLVVNVKIIRIWILKL